MFAVALRQAIRRLTRQWPFTLIQVIGFTLGLSVVAAIGLYLHEEYTFDAHHENYATIHRVITTRPGGNGDSQNMPYAVATLAPALKERIPEVTESARLMAMFNWVVSHEDQRHQVESMVAADPELFDILTFNFLEGDKQEALTSPDQVIISDKIAEQFFGDKSALGMPLTFEGTRVLTVAGVFESMPEKSHMTLDVIVPYEIFTRDEQWDWLNHWYTATVTYVMLAPGVDSATLNDRLNPIIAELLPEQPGISMWLQPLSDVHLKSSNIIWDFAAYTSSMNNVWLFLVIGLGTIALALINFVNLSTARSMLRSRETGIRKIVGATSASLFGQAILDAVLISMIALPLALLLIELTLPGLRTLFERPLANIYLSLEWPLFALLGFTVVTGLLAGIYPSLIISSFPPIRVLSGQLKTGGKAKNLRRGLVLVQFVMSILLLLLVGAVYHQVDYLKKQPLGWNVDQVIVLPVSSEITGGDFMAMRDQVIADPGVVSAAMSEVVPGVSTAEDNVTPTGWEGDPITIHKNIICDKYVETFNLNLVAGRNFDPARPGDLYGCLVNESAIAGFGWEDWEGKNVKGQSGRDFPVLGVVEDYHFMSLHTAVEPQFLIYYPPRGAQMSVLVQAEGMNDTIERLGVTWKEHIPDRPYDYQFLDERVSDWYLAEERNARMLTLFGSLALIVSSLGLLGLAAFIAEQRKFEIGVRKVLGASQGNILVLVLREFLTLVLIANVISWLISLKLEPMWAEQFILHAPLAWWMLPAAIGVTVVTVLLVTGVLAWRASSVNPITVIRTE
jgi:putative ABC transport system permease protein